jgi:hypothetical protein
MITLATTTADTWNVLVRELRPVLRDPFSALFSLVQPLVFLVICLVSLPFGFTVSVPGLLLGFLLLAVFGIGFGALSYSVALACRNRDWMFWIIHQTLIFPLMISGMLLPLADAPGWLTHRAG